MGKMLSRRQMQHLCICLALGLLLCSLWQAAAWGRTQLHTGDAVCADTLRLHIRAASDSVADQSAKLRVRDAVLACLDAACPAGNQTDARSWAARNLFTLQLAAEDALRQITRDHSMVQQLVDSGQITREQAAIHPQKNLITRALGVSANIVPEYNRCEIEEGDILLLCTDGLTNMVSDDDIAQVLREVPFFDATSILVDRALQAGGQDNITVLLMGVETTEVNNG